MKRIFFLLFFVLILFPISSSFSQLTEKPPSLGVILTSFTPYHFTDEDGYTIIIGEVENTTNFPVTSLKIWAGFYDDINEQPLEFTIGTTIVDVIPPLKKVPYMIKSPSPNPAITGVSVNLLGFDSAPPKNEELAIESKISEVGEQIKISGTITNNAPIDASQTKIHLFFYDAFIPPRIIWISTIELEEIESGSSINFEFDENFDSRSSGYKIFAESSDFFSNVEDTKITRPKLISKLVTISYVSITDKEGNKLSEISVDSIVDIQSKIWIQYAIKQETFEQPYVYYAQVKQSGEKAFVEFIGIYEGIFNSEEPQFPTAEWIPEKEGVYFIETFVWDPKAIPLASKGPVLLVLVT